jgi:hypothetical protein
MVAKALPRATRALIASTHPEPKRESAPRVLPRINHGLFHDSPAFSANVMPNISGSGLSFQETVRHDFESNRKQQAGFPWPSQSPRWPSNLQNFQVVVATVSVDPTASI